MPTEKEILMIQKATMFDLKQILEADPDKTYTVEELKKIIDAYIAGQTQMHRMRTAVYTRTLTETIEM